MNQDYEVQAFGDIVDANIVSNLESGEHLEVNQTFTYLDRLIHSSTSCEVEVDRRLVRV